MSLCLLFFYSNVQCYPLLLPLCHQKQKISLSFLGPYTWRTRQQSSFRLGNLIMSEKDNGNGQYSQEIIRHGLSALKSKGAPPA